MPPFPSPRLLSALPIPTSFPGQSREEPLLDGAPGLVWERGGRGKEKSEGRERGG